MWRTAQPAELIFRPVVTFPKQANPAVLGLSGAAKPVPVPPPLTRAPLGSRCVSVLDQLGSLVVRGGAQISVPPPALALLLFFILQSPLPGQAGGRGEGQCSPGRSPGSLDPQSPSP